MTDETVPSDIPTSRMLSWARNSAIYRLERRMMTEKQLFDAISRKAKEKFEDISAAQLKAIADFAVKFAYDNKVLDDSAYAEISTRSAVRGGKSKRAIAQKLAAKGVSSDKVGAALEEADDLYAAAIFARKRAFGPFRRVELDEKRKAKELSAFARNGFSFDIGRKIFDMSFEDAEEVILAGRSLVPQHQRS
ncbi:recombination regulator RecX [Rhizobium leguminosarum]|jgi:regulatory protein|uniref:Regulatory protein RecX n=1 Tax=Rhizobium leguminosarum bv. trifolii (strain WSM1325) TaxID=395491 RepID=C6B362_RHILS|nr:recombination regulator RecX [Rhizobium leguminosarum]ACS58764.1 regulatory protein RecX [Rhizobium leguminosarum bv. trifolii WSM1325]MBY2907099.1 recombination regulator RecX [Rhizobium leguminosarum]MBY2920084.1 recombination regulator RecX [Rhizobium leguminosarum]MBY2932482.1 recombination regulator RecX [Rhizobium leguminosarum]MBY2946414.1 recombination regulator RecX [Rhizobium leguminosarum]